MNYARRQQYRRLSHAGKGALGSVVAAAARARDRERGSGGARRAAAPRRGRAGSLRSALAFARWSQSSRRPLGGRGAARARPSPGGGVAAAALAALARPGRHRLRGDRPAQTLTAWSQKERRSPMTRPSRHRKSRPTPATSSAGQCKPRGPCWVASPRRGAANSRSRYRSSSKPVTNSYRRWTPIPVPHQASTATEPATRRRRRRAVPRAPRRSVPAATGTR